MPRLDDDAAVQSCMPPARWPVVWIMDTQSEISIAAAGMPSGGDKPNTKNYIPGAQACLIWTFLASSCGSNPFQRQGFPSQNASETEASSLVYPSV